MSTEQYAQRTPQSPAVHTTRGRVPEARQPSAAISRSEREKQSQRAKMIVTQVVASMNSRRWKNQADAAIAW
jgi:hypothetical protein